MCTACGRNNSPEWRKVSSIPFPTPHPPFFPISGCPCMASPRFGSSSVMEVPGLAVTATPAAPPRLPRDSFPPCSPVLFPMARPLRGKGASQTGPWPYNRASLLPMPNCLPLQDKVTNQYFCISLALPLPPTRRLSLFAVPEYPVFGSPRFTMHQNDYVTLCAGF